MFTLRTVFYTALLFLKVFKLIYLYDLFIHFVFSQNNIGLDVKYLSAHFFTNPERNKHVWLKKEIKKKRGEEKKITIDK